MGRAREIRWLRLRNKNLFYIKNRLIQHAKQEIDFFLKSSRLDHPNGEYAFLWHGLMGYTKNGLRMIGPDPRNNRLLYNLGCNGVGILPSIYGGKRIADYVQFGVLDESIFDVR